MLTAADVRRRARVALILRAGRRVDVHKGVPEVQDPDFWGLPLHTPIVKGMRKLTAKQQGEFASLSDEERTKYFGARQGGKVTHPVALKAVRAAAKKAAPAKAAPVKKAPARKAAKTARPPAKPIPIRDLFDADDATIEAALRDVYEGQFGPYTTKVRVFITRAGTHTDKRGRKHAVEPSIGVDGEIFDASGRKIGYFGRSIEPFTLHYVDGRVRREIWAYHPIVQLGDADDKRTQGKGFGGAFNRRAIEWYRASGIHGIGQKDHNGYVWASQGFNFGQGGAVPEYLVEDMRQLVADLRAGKMRSSATKDEYPSIPKAVRDAPDLDSQIAAAEALLARLDSTKPGDPDYPTAYEISQLGRTTQRGKTGVWLGKLLFVPADEMVLNPDEGEELQRAQRVEPDRIVVKRHNDLFDLWADYAIQHADVPDYDPDDDPEFVAKAHRLMGVRS